VLRVKGKIVQHLTRELRAFSAMKEALILTADGYRTLTMKWMSVCSNTTTAPSSFPEHAIDTAKTTPCINCPFLCEFYFHSRPPPTSHCHAFLSVSYGSFSAQYLNHLMCQSTKSSFAQ
jgi:hypothetical protein